MRDTIKPAAPRAQAPLPKLADLRWHDDARVALEVHRNVLLVGPPGSGKTTFAEREAWVRTGRAPLRLQGTPRTDVHHIWGRTALRDGSTGFDENVLHRALVEARVLVVEDFGLIPHDVRAYFLALRGDLPITNPETGEAIAIPSAFRLIATTNDERVGCRRTGGIARALLDDFLVVEADAPSSEDSLAMVRVRLAHMDGALVERAFELWRSGCDLHSSSSEDERIRPSVRAVEHIAKLLERGVSSRRAMSMALIGKYILNEDAHEAARNFLSLQSYADDREKDGGGDE